MAVKSCKGLKRCENTKHQASLVKTPLEDICSRSGSLEANSEMRGRGFELCIRDQYPQQEKRGRLAQRLKCRAHRIPPGRSSGASATHPPCPELGPNGQTFVSSSLRHGMWPAPLVAAFPSLKGDQEVHIQI